MFCGTDNIPQIILEYFPHYDLQGLHQVIIYLKIKE